MKCAFLFLFDLLTSYTHKNTVISKIIFTDPLSHAHIIKNLFYNSQIDVQAKIFATLKSVTYTYNIYTD